MILKKGGNVSKLSSENSNILIEIIKSYKKIFIELLSDILKLKIKDFKGTSIEKFEDISEYEFSLIKINALLFNNNKVDIHLKIVNRDKIKENIFCYWSLIYEKELKRKKKINKKEPLVSKVTISDIGKERYKSSVLLEIQDNPNHILEYGAELHFVDTIKYINKSDRRFNKFIFLKKFFNKNNEELLLVGVILNKQIGRCNIEL